MQKIVVTGAAGFIGWRVCEKLLKEGKEVLGLDDLNDYYDVRIKKWRLGQLQKNRNFSFSQLDISQPAKTEKIIKKFQPVAIINLAARAGVRYSLKNPFVYYQTNVLGTLNLLEICRKYRIKKFILASTSSLYAGQKMPFSEDLPVNEPISPYAASKKSAEVTCYTYHYLYGLDVTIFRYFTVYGPGGRPDMCIFRFIKWLEEGKPLTIYGDGSQSRDFTFVEDIAEGTIKGISLTGFQTINLGGNKPYQINQVIQLIEKYLGKKSQRKNQAFQKVDMKATWADISQAKKLLRWRPEISLKEGLKLTVAWHQANYDWLKNVKI